MDSFETDGGRCERSGIVCEGVNSSGVRETLCSSPDGEDAEGGRTSAVRGSVSDFPMGTG